MNLKNPKYIFLNPSIEKKCQNPLLDSSKVLSDFITIISQIHLLPQTQTLLFGINLLELTLPIQPPNSIPSSPLQNQNPLSQIPPISKQLIIILITTLLPLLGLLGLGFSRSSPTSMSMPLPMQALPKGSSKSPPLLSLPLSLATARLSVCKLRLSSRGILSFSSGPLVF